MADLEARWSRLAFVAALTVVAFVQLDQFARTLGWQGRLRVQYVRAMEDSLSARLPQLAGTLTYGGPAAWHSALSMVRELHPLAEVELFDAGGNRLAAVPGPPAVEHQLDSEQRRALTAGRVLTVGPVGDGEPRMLTYVPLRSGGADVLMRIAVPAPELAQQVRERRELLLAQGLALFALAVAAALALFPARRSDAPATAPRAMDAYLEAMSRLGELGRAQSEQHVAERQRLEERIRVAEPMARAGELTSGIVHEVRNGLGTIVGYARLVEQSGAGAEARDAAARIRAECETLEQFVRRFIEFVKAETLTVGPVEVRRMLARVAAHEAGGRPGAEVSLTPGDEVALSGDEELLERAFENLVRNAREAAGLGGHVVVNTRPDGDEVAITVADDGPGLTPAQRDALRPFHTTKPGGLGLGLPLALKIVRLHGGEMTMAPRHPRGLVLTVRLPLSGPRPAHGPEPGPDGPRDA